MQSSMPILSMQFVKTFELSIIAYFAHMDRLPNKQQIDSVFSGSLTAWFLSLAPTSLGNQIA